MATHVAIEQKHNLSNHSQPPTDKKKTPFDMQK